MQSVWQERVALPTFDALKGEKHVDICIIGGGMCGLLCAYFLEQRNVNYILLEGKQIGSGITKNTTAKITSQHGLIYQKLIKSYGYEKAKMYLEANQLALGKYKELSKTIQCDLEEKEAYTYTLEERKKVEEEVKAVKALGFPSEFVEQTELPFAIKGSIRFPNQAQFHPLKFIGGVVQNLNIWENSQVKSVDVMKNIVLTDNGRINAKRIIVATHFPFINTHGSYFLKLYQHRSFVVACRDALEVKGMYVDENEKGLSFRSYKDLLLIGGGDHRTGKQGGNYTELRRVAHQYYPLSKEAYAWATQDCMSLDQIPYIGHYSKRTPNLFVASGFNKWGMTSSMASALILTDMVMGKENEFQSVFSPHRSMIKPQLFVNGWEATTNLLSLSTKRCPHMGCTLQWNSTEQTWDCPCHGSRFEQDGTLIDNPATGSIQIKKK
jgi:glycine/D-amino acid oxidase-like deaminating enzyme